MQRMGAPPEFVARRSRKPRFRLPPVASYVHELVVPDCSIHLGYTPVGGHVETISGHAVLYGRGLSRLAVGRLRSASKRTDSRAPSIDPRRHSQSGNLRGHCQSVDRADERAGESGVTNGRCSCNIHGASAHRQQWHRRRMRSS
jgi:hypothetical protein